jgi:hypothetical protein
MQLRPCLIVAATAAVLVVMPPGRANAQAERLRRMLGQTPEPASSSDDDTEAEKFRRILGLTPEKGSSSDDTTTSRPTSRLPKRFYVLSIGISNYGDPRNNLRTPAKNARNVAEVFSRQAPGSTVKLLLDDDATADRITNALKDLESEVQPGDFVVVFLCGHGAREGGDWNFICRDSPLPGSSITSPLRKLVERGDTVMLAIDSCNAGQLARNSALGTNSVLDNLAAPSHLLGGGFIFLAGSYPAELGNDGDENSLFSAALLEALTGRADLDSDGFVTVKELRSFLAWRIEEETYRVRKLPGIAWPEQNCLSLVSASISESLQLTRSEGVGRLRPNEPGEWFMREIFPPDVYYPARSIPGTWQASWPITGADGTPMRDRDGKPVQRIYTLILTEDGHYAASDQVGDVFETKTAGRYIYRASEKLSPAQRLTEQLTGIPARSLGGEFTLIYSNGRDRIRVEGGGPDVIKIIVYPEPSYQPGAELELRRVGTDVPRR